MRAQAGRSDALICLMVNCIARDRSTVPINSDKLGAQLNARLVPRWEANENVKQQRRKPC
jgi:hypothetical protein